MTKNTKDFQGLVSYEEAIQIEGDVYCSLTDPFGNENAILSRQECTDRLENLKRNVLQLKKMKK